MPSVYTIEGARRPKRRRKRGRDLRGVAAGTCERVPHGKSGRCTIERCKGADGRWRFKRGTTRCG